MIYARRSYLGMPNALLCSIRNKNKLGIAPGIQGNLDIKPQPLMEKIEVKYKHLSKLENRASRFHGGEKN